MVYQHVSQEKNGAVTSCFSAHLRATILHAFSRQDANKFVGNSFVLTEHKTDFSAANADVACRYISISANMTVELSHEGLAKAHDLIVAFTFRVEICATFAAAHRQTRKTVLEGLFKT